MKIKATAWSWIPLGMVEVQQLLSGYTPVQRGIYLSLYVRCGSKGYLETDLNVLRTACGVRSQYMKDIQLVLDSGFVYEETRYTHPMLKPYS